MKKSIAMALGLLFIMTTALFVGSGTDNAKKDKTPTEYSSLQNCTDSYELPVEAAALAYAFVESPSMGIFDNYLAAFDTPKQVALNYDKDLNYTWLNDRVHDANRLIPNIKNKRATPLHIRGELCVDERNC